LAPVTYPGGMPIGYVGSRYATPVKTTAVLWVPTLMELMDWRVTLLAAESEIRERVAG
jgi:hypothetical protein